MKVNIPDTTPPVDLHSTMVLFKFCLTHSPSNIESHLHSTMVLFKLHEVLFDYRDNKIYIPLWSYSNNITYKKNVQRDFIYIPLWSYSNLKKNRFSDTPQGFTFHYGPIQINCSITLSTSYAVFTFHYGPIQMATQDTLVWAANLIYIPLWSYSNQRNQNDTYICILDLHSTMVLFKLLHRSTGK